MSCYQPEHSIAWNSRTSGKMQHTQEIIMFFDMNLHVLHRHCWGSQVLFCIGGCCTRSFPEMLFGVSNISVHAENYSFACMVFYPHNHICNAIIKLKGFVILYPWKYKHDARQAQDLAAKKKLQFHIKYAEAVIYRETLSFCLYHTLYLNKRPKYLIKSHMIIRHELCWEFIFNTIALSSRITRMKR